MDSFTSRGYILTLVLHQITKLQWIINNQNLAHPFSKFHMSCLYFIIISCLGQTLPRKPVNASLKKLYNFRWDIRIFLKMQLAIQKDHSRWLPKRLPTFVITRSDKSMRFIRRSEIAFLTYWTAPGISLLISILWRQSLTRFFTNKQLSLRTVSIPAKWKFILRGILRWWQEQVVDKIQNLPLVSILSKLSGFVQNKPAYLFLLIRRYG